MPEDDIERARNALDPDEPEHFELWRENDAALAIFLSLSTQWRAIESAAGVKVVGLNYPAVESVLRIRKVRDRERVFSDIQIMESAVLPILNNRDDG